MSAVNSGQPLEGVLADRSARAPDRARRRCRGGGASGRL